MAIARQPYYCYLCGELIESLHADRGKHFVGDTFIGYKEHHCDPKKKEAFQKRNKAVPQEVPISELPEHLQKLAKEEPDVQERAKAWVIEKHDKIVDGRIIPRLTENDFHKYLEDAYLAGASSLAKENEELKDEVEKLRELVETAYSEAYNTGYGDCRHKHTLTENPFDQFKKDHNL
jgi:hypothetical protein